MQFELENRAVWLATVVTVAVLALLIWQVDRARPPVAFRIATGPEESQSHRVAQQYVDAIRERGFQLEIIPTRGVVETVDMMRSGAADAGFLENAATLDLDLTGISALAAVYPEPVWIFYRKELDNPEPLDSLSDLRGRVAIGDAQSGSNWLMRLLFELSEVGEDQVELVEVPDDVAASQLLDGALNAAVIVGGINSDPVLDLLLSPEIEVLNLRRVDALTILVPFLDSVLLPEGVIRLKDNRPPEDKHMLTTQAVLATRNDLHPDLQRLLLTVAEEEHEQSQWFEDPGQYPNQEGLLLDLSPVAKEFHERSATFLERYLPFWIASPLERFYLLIFPILILLYPLMRNSPSLYQRVMRRRVYRWYSAVRTAELRLMEYSPEELDDKIAELSRLNSQLLHTLNVPTGYLERYYNLRLHIRLVLDEMRERRYELLTGASDSAEPRTKR